MICNLRPLRNKIAKRALQSHICTAPAIHVPFCCCYNSCTCTCHTCMCHEWIQNVRIIPGGGLKNRTVDTVDYSGLSSDQQLSFSLCWIEHLFLIIMTPRSSIWLRTFYFMSNFRMDCQFSGFARFPEFRARLMTINGKSRKWGVHKKLLT